MMRGYEPWAGTRGLAPRAGMHRLGPAVGALGGLFVLLAIVAIVVLVVVLLRKKPGMAHHIPATMPMAATAPPAEQFSDALDVAAKRYAAGEITKEQYEEIRSTLSGGATPS